MFSFATRPPIPAAPPAACLTALVALTALAPAAAQDPLAVDLSTTPEGLRILLHAQPEPLVSLRLSAPVPADAPEGTVELLQELASPAARQAAERIGATIHFRHDGAHAVIAVAGPADDLESLARLLRRATAPPEVSAAALLTARARAEDRLLGRLEQPAPRARALLWSALLERPEPGAADGLRLAPDAIRPWHARLYAPDRMSLAVVGPVDPATVHAVLATPAAGLSTAHAGPTGGARQPRDRPRYGPTSWTGLAYPLRAELAVVAVAAELVAGLADTPAPEPATVESWSTPAGPALVLLGAAGASGGPEALRRLVAAAAADPAAVEHAARRLRSRILLEARSGPGKAEVIGRLADATGEADGASSFLSALSRVDARAVHAVLERARATGPVEIPGGVP